MTSAYPRMGQQAMAERFCQQDCWKRFGCAWPGVPGEVGWEGCREC